MAAVIESGPVNINVPNTLAGVYLNVVTGVAGADFASKPNYDVNPYNNNSGLTFFSEATDGCVANGTTAGSACLALVVGNTVGPAGPYRTGQALGTNFRTTGDRYLGIRFLNEGTGVINYGYVTIRSTTAVDPNGGFPASIIRYVYDNAGVPIVIAAPGTDLALTQSNNAPGTLFIGDTFVKTLTVTNNGPVAATNVMVSDTLPAQLTFVSSNCGAVAAGQVVTYTIASLAVSGVNSCALTLRVTAPGTITNTATITGSTPADTTPANNTSTAQIGPAGGGVPPTADLALTQSNNAPATFFVGDTFVKSLTVTNGGPVTATNIMVADTLPAQLTFVSSTCGAVATGQVVTYTIASLANGANSVCALTLRVTATGTITNTATITSSMPADPTPANNTTTAQIGPAGGGVPPTADLSITQTNTADGNALLIGMTFVKTLTVSNAGPFAATAITVTDTLPPQLMFVSSNCGAVATGQVVTYTIANLAIGASSSCALTLRIVATGTIVNTAAVTSSTPPDPTPASTTAQIGTSGGGVAQTPVPALDRNMVLVLLGLVSALGMLALRQRQA